VKANDQVQLQGRLQRRHFSERRNAGPDATKLARLLKGGNFPIAYAYPKGMRETRDLMRRRTYLVRQRAELLTHVQILNAQYNLAPFPKILSFAANRAEMDVAARFADPSVQKSAAADLALVDRLDELIDELGCTWCAPRPNGGDLGRAQPRALRKTQRLGRRSP
jgi:hypothetical protein